jgi:peptide-methionine (S)-S-oxide reductase
MKKRQIWFASFILFLFTKMAFADQKLKTAILGTGCFWCTQADMEKVKGVKSAIPGYSGGKLKNPTYKNHEGHIEVVQVTYDPQTLSYKKLLDKFWIQHVPTDSGGSFCDRGHSYRNVLFYSNENEKNLALQTKASLQKKFSMKIQTLILKAKTFTRAEEYHIHYATKNPLRYKYYRWSCKRDQTLKLLWKKNQ